MNSDGGRCKRQRSGSLVAVAVGLLAGPGVEDATTWKASADRCATCDTSFLDEAYGRDDRLGTVAIGGDPAATLLERYEYDRSDELRPRFRGELITPELGAGTTPRAVFNAMLTVARSYRRARPSRPTSSPPSRPPREGCRSPSVAAVLVARAFDPRRGVVIDVGAMKGSGWIRSSTACAGRLGPTGVNRRETQAFGSRPRRPRYQHRRRWFTLGSGSGWLERCMARLDTCCRRTSSPRWRPRPASPTENEDHSGGFAAAAATRDRDGVRVPAAPRRADHSRRPYPVSRERPGGLPLLRAFMKEGPGVGGGLVMLHAPPRLRPRRAGKPAVDYRAGFGPLDTRRGRLAPLRAFGARRRRRTTEPSSRCSPCSTPECQRGGVTTGGREPDRYPTRRSTRSSPAGRRHSPFQTCSPAAAPWPP